MNSPVEQHLKELEVVCLRHRVRRLELFGSALGPRGVEPNDLDFLVEFQPLPPGRYADAYFGLLESLEGIFQKHVDLVVGSSITNPYFRQSIDATKRLVYVA